MSQCLHSGHLLLMVAYDGAAGKGVVPRPWAAASDALIPAQQSCQSSTAGTHPNKKVDKESTDS